MNIYAKLAAGAAAVLVVAVVGYQLLPGAGGPGAPPTASPTPQATPSISLSGAASPPLGVHTVKPFFGPEGFGMCAPPAIDPTCVEDPRDDSIAVTFELPDDWERFEELGALIDGDAPPDGSAVFFYRGNWLYSDPCRPPNGEATPDVPVGPSVDDFVSALVDHPSINVTPPVEVALAGYSGKYVDLTVPDDIGDCDVYRPIDAHIYAQGPGHRWHMWVLDVGGVRVLVETNDYAGTPPQRLAEIQAILDSLVITR